VGKVKTLENLFPQVRGGVAPVLQGATRPTQGVESDAIQWSQSIPTVCELVPGNQSQT